MLQVGYVVPRKQLGWSSNLLGEWPQVGIKNTFNRNTTLDDHSIGTTRPRNLEPVVCCCLPTMLSLAKCPEERVRNVLLEIRQRNLVLGTSTSLLQTSSTTTEMLGNHAVGRRKSDNQEVT